MFAFGAKTDSPEHLCAAPSRQIPVLTPARSSEEAVLPTTVQALRLKLAAMPITCGKTVVPGPMVPCRACSKEATGR